MGYWATTRSKWTEQYSSPAWIPCSPYPFFIFCSVNQRGREERRSGQRPWQWRRSTGVSSFSRLIKGSKSPTLSIASNTNYSHPYCSPHLGRNSTRFRRGSPVPGGGDSVTHTRACAVGGCSCVLATAVLAPLGAQAVAAYGTRRRGTCTRGMGPQAKGVQAVLHQAHGSRRVSVSGAGFVRRRHWTAQRGVVLRVEGAVGGTRARACPFIERERERSVRKWRRRRCHAGF